MQIPKRISYSIFLLNNKSCNNSSWKQNLIILASSNYADKIEESPPLPGVIYCDTKGVRKKKYRKKNTSPNKIFIIFKEHISCLSFKRQSYPDNSI